MILEFFVLEVARINKNNAEAQEYQAFIIAVW